MTEDDWTDVDEDLFLTATAEENSVNFSRIWHSSASVENFLERDEYLAVRGTVVSDSVEWEQYLKHTTDIDGIIIEWDDISMGLDLNFTHLDIIPRGIQSLQKIFPLLKKHLKLDEFSQRGLDALKISVGSQLIYHSGWSSWLGFVPSNSCHVVFEDITMRRLVKLYFDEIRNLFQAELRTLLKQRQAMKTLAKNNLNNASRLFILPGDQSKVLSCLQIAINRIKMKIREPLEPVLFTFRFGEKIELPLSLPIYHKTAVREISVHIGHTISSDSLDFMWCRTGLKELVGSRGTLGTSLGLFECANFQSNLDGRSLTVHNNLKEVCNLPQNIRFLQLYSDVAHVYPKTRIHPVACSVILLENLLRPDARQSLYNDVQTYLDTLQSNFSQFIDGKCRLEFVITLPDKRSEINPVDFINMDNLSKMFAMHPVLVPFSKSVKIFEKLQCVGYYLYKQLRDIFENRKGISSIRYCWESFQFELAAEKLLWGHPLFFASRQYSINLGPGVETPSRCVSDRMGFLCLENAFSCCADEGSLPPISIFSKNETIQRQLVKVAGIGDLMDGDTHTLGRRVMHCILQDFYDTGSAFTTFDNFVKSIQKDQTQENKRIVGGISISDLVDKISCTENAKFPMVFANILSFLRKHQMDLKELIKAGIISLSLRLFPAVRNYDSSRNNYLNWKYSFGFWVIVDTSLESSDTMDSVSMQQLVLAEVEKRELFHSSQYHKTVFPWIMPVLKRISEKKLIFPDVVKVITFVTCVALLQGGYFVHFKNLKVLIQELPLSQGHLKALEILSKFELPFFRGYTIYRLHNSIPSKLNTDSQNKQQDHRAEEKNVRDTEQTAVSSEMSYHEIEQTQNTLSENICDTDVMRHLPTNLCYTRWTSVELDILVYVARTVKGSLANKYDAYQKQCREQTVPDRSFLAFKKKFNRYQDK